MRRYIAIVLCMTMLVGLLVLQASAVDTVKKRLTVIGVRNEIDRSEWNNQLIGYGLSNLLLQRLFDLGHYVAIEDNPEIVDKIQHLIKSQWQRQASFYSPGDADRIAMDLGSEVVAYAKVIKFSTKRRRGFAGPFSGAKTKVIVELEVSLKEQGKPVMVARGKGEASTKSVGVFFEIRKDVVYFDKTTVGKAAHKAIDNAINGLGVK